MRFSPDIRKIMRHLLKKGLNKTRIAELFDTTRQTVHRWCKRAFHRGRESFKDKPRRSKKSKITVEVEVSILTLRNSFDWGTARIQQGLYCLPEYARKAIRCVQGVSLSRTAINSVLKKHGINGYKHNYKGWKFFRASKPNELWQVDIKGPYTVQGRKYWFVVCIDDYSRYLILAEQLDHDPRVEEIGEMLKPQVEKHRPENILTDNKPFREEWDGWCRINGIEPLHAHPYYPQDKGKVERAIRNLNEEFVHLLRKFPEWLRGKLKDYKEWYNEKRFHLGIRAIPSELYKCNVRNFT